MTLATAVPPRPRTAIIVVAAGSGARLAAGAPKAFVRLGSRSILSHSLDQVFRAQCAQVVVVVPVERTDEALTLAQDAAGADRSHLVTVVAGGASRQESVAAGLDAVWADIDTVLVHDAARALTPPEMMDRVIVAVQAGAPAVIPVLPVVDTLKQVSGTAVTAAVDRSMLAAAQTPQGFRRDALIAAYGQAAEDHTDDAALMQSAGWDVITVDGDARAFKITTPDDLERARSLVNAMPLPRIGVGTDVHAFGGDGTLWLAGLEWPGEQGLDGHSDGDAVAHAIVDAVLAAAGLGDIGVHFGTDKPEYAGAHAPVFLRRTAEILREAGWHIGNVSVQVQARRPRFAARRTEAERVLSEALGAPVSVSATTTDGLGFTGTGEGVSAYAVALVFGS